MNNESSGFTLIETLIGIAILAVISTAIYFSYANVIEIVQAAQYNSAALSIIEGQVETVRNMRYEDVGTAGGVPAGKVPQTQQFALGGQTFTLNAFVRNIDDPFDGILGGSPNDTAPADYKLVHFQVTCDTCTRYRLIQMATYVAPKNLESTSKNGNLFIRVFDAAGLPVQGATVTVSNPSAVPPINLTDITNSDGQLQLVDTATGSAAYHITVTKSGYSSDQTYAPGSPPNPTKPDATVATQQLTITSLAIDRVATLNITTRDRLCAPAAGFDFLLTGTKLIGTLPDTPKYSQSNTTAASGIADVNTLEWDTYTVAPTDTVWDLAGTTASLAFTLNPSAVNTQLWQIASRSGNALTVSVFGTGGVPLNDATVRVHGGGYDRSEVTGRSTYTATDWSGTAYDSQSGNISADTSLQLAPAGGPYASGSSEWLISRTIDFGTSTAAFTNLSWTPTSQPSGAGPNSLKLQLAANNNGTTWNYVGPDGTGATYFTSSGTTVPAALSGNQYLRYRVELATQSTSDTPSLDDLSLGFSSTCLVAGQAYFNGLGGTKTLEVSAPGYQSFSTTVDTASSWQRTTVTLTP
jgi:prepilin-type N-terminal cleavage/methylation domain-containing protein